MRIRTGTARRASGASPPGRRIRSGTRVAIKCARSAMICQRASRKASTKAHDCVLLAPGQHPRHAPNAAGPARRPGSGRPAFAFGGPVAHCRHFEIVTSMRQSAVEPVAVLRGRPLAGGHARNRLDTPIDRGPAQALTARDCRRRRRARTQRRMRVRARCRWCSGGRDPSLQVGRVRTGLRATPIKQ